MTLKEHSIYNLKKRRTHEKRKKKDRDDLIVSSSYCVTVLPWRQRNIFFLKKNEISLFNHFTCSWLRTILLISRRKNHIKLIKNDDGKSKIAHCTCKKK